MKREYPSDQLGNWFPNKAAEGSSHTRINQTNDRFDSVGLKIVGGNRTEANSLQQCGKMPFLESAWKISPGVCDSLTLCRGTEGGESLWWGRRKEREAISWWSGSSATQIVPDPPVTPTREVEKWSKTTKVQTNGWAEPEQGRACSPPVSSGRDATQPSGLQPGVDIDPLSCSHHATGESSVLPPPHPPPGEQSLHA